VPFLGSERGKKEQAKQIPPLNAQLMAGRTRSDILVLQCAEVTTDLILPSGVYLILYNYIREIH
jgi:hypothetical protein